MSGEGHLTAALGQMTVNVDTLVTMYIAMGVLLVFAFIASRKLTIIPSKLQMVTEYILTFFTSITGSMIGDKAESKKHVPLLATLFIFIVTANLMGQLPWRLIHLKTGELASPTNDINLTAAMAVIVLVYYLYCGIRKKGLRYFLHSFNPIDIVIAIVELLEIVIRPFTLALRLFANILAGELLVVAFVGIFAYFLPLPIMFFEVFVGFVQALVFMMLSTAYVALAVEEE